MRFAIPEVDSSHPQVSVTTERGWHDVTPARLMAVMQRERLVPPVIGVMLECGCPDGDGAARDEVVVMGPEGNDILARFRPVEVGEPPAGAASWQLALAILDDAFEGDAPLDSLPLFATLAAETVHAAREARREPREPSRLAVRHHVEALEALGWWRCPPADRAQGGWRAQAAEHERRRYRYEITRVSHPWELDLRPAVRDATFELIGGERPARVTARFLNTIGAATADLVRGAACIHGKVPVVFAGSCFAAAGLSARISRELAGDFQVVQET
jgi:hypothetical protein